MVFLLFGKEVVLSAGQVQALVGGLTALYAIARAFGLVDLGGVPVV